MRGESHEDSAYSGLASRKTLEGRSRLEEQAEFLDELNQIVKDEHIDVIVMAGDAFDTVNPPARAEQLFMKVCLHYLIKESVRWL